jgi:hypothetical protein
MPRWDGPAPQAGRLSKNPSEYKIRFTSAAHVKAGRSGSSAFRLTKLPAQLKSPRF